MLVRARRNETWTVFNGINNTSGSDTRERDAMPLTQEKPRFEYAFTNNNDHNYLHKKFKKMASTVPVSDEQSSESDSSLHKENSKVQTIHTPQSSISNRSIAAAHPEIEKIKAGEASTEVYNVDRKLENNVQTIYKEKINLNDVNNFNQKSGETSFADETLNKTDNIETDVPREFANGAVGGRYICPYCKLSCAKPSVLQKHIRAHTNERPYPCVPCGFAFKTKSNLYKHCRSRTHTLRLQGADNVPPINEDDWSPESESDGSLPATSISDTGSEGVVIRLENSRTSELSSPELPSDRITPPTMLVPPITNTEICKSKTIYKPKFHRASLYQDEKERNKKRLSPNPDFLNEHISKIISDNEAIVDVLESPLQKKYGKIKQIAESKQNRLEDNSLNAEVKSEALPLNLTKTSSESESALRKRRYSESFSQMDLQKHPLNPEGSIIKDLLLKKANLSGLMPVSCETDSSGSELLYICNLCQISYKSAENLEIHRLYYCKGNHNSNGLTSINTKDAIKSRRPENIFARSHSINVTLQETHSPNSLAKLASSTLKSPPIRGNKPENLIVKSDCCDIVAPLPSPGPLLGNTRLVDSRANMDYSRSKIMPMNSPKRKLESRLDNYSPRSSEDILHKNDTYSHNKIRCFENNPTTLRSLEELSQSPMRQNSTSLQMFGGEVKILNHSGSTTTLRIEPTRTQLSPIMIPQNLSPSKQSVDGESSSIVIRSGLHSGGTMVHNPPTPKETISSPHPQTPHIMLSIAASIPTPNLTVSCLPTPNITHFQFPPIGAITAFNPLTLPPLSPSLSPNGATKILHGGKLIPHVPGMPGPNTPASYIVNSGIKSKFSPSSEPSRANAESPKDDFHQNRLTVNQHKTKGLLIQKTERKFLNPQSNARSPILHIVNRGVETSNYNLLKSENQLVESSSIPTIKIRDMDEQITASVKGFTTNTVKYTQSRMDGGQRNNEILNRGIGVLKETNYDGRKVYKLSEKLNLSVSNVDNAAPKITEAEIRYFNFENLITKSEIYNNQIPSSSDVQKNTHVQEELSIQTFERSETLYFQKNNNANMLKEENKPRFLRPSTLPLKPGTFTPKKHHGITPNSNTLPLVSPETPRPAKAYGQLYLNGNAYTYLGLKCSTKVFYCTVNRPQPTYVPNQHSLSMYSNWQMLSEIQPHPLGLSTGSAMSLYDSRHRPQNITIAVMQQDHILTHSSQWKNTFKDNSQKTSPTDRKGEEFKASSAESSNGNKNKELAGGFESNEEYTYVRGRGRGRYVCSECGIRCKKPSMLKKHIRTHTDVRPYTCKHCAFSFKTKGNLTKHMKSKAHYKKCCELGINPSEGTDIDTCDMNQGSGETDDETDSDIDDGNEGETESSDTDSWKSRLPEHEAAHCLLSLWGTRPSSSAAPGLLTSARPSTYPYTPTGSDETSHPGSATTPSGKIDSYRSNSTEPPVELDNEPMDLSKEVRSTTIPEIPTARESSVLASLASNTAKLPSQHNQWSNGEPMLQAYLTERALLDTKIKQSQFISVLSKVRKQEPNKIVQHESGNIISSTSYPTFMVQDVTPCTQVRKTAETISVFTNITKPSLVSTKDTYSEKSTINVAESLGQVNSNSNQIISNTECHKNSFVSDVTTNTNNAKYVASEYLKMARVKEIERDEILQQVLNSKDKSDKQDDSMTILSSGSEDMVKREQNDKETDLKNFHSDPVARKVVVGAGGVAFTIGSKAEDLHASSAYTPGRLTEDGRSVCVVCNKSFSKPSQLRLHINIHYMERPFRCSACAVSFRTRGHLQKHERSGSHHNKVSMTSTFGAATSSNPRPFRCSDCNIAFRIHGHLAKHLRSKMHVMKLECLGKLPFGTFAEIERAGVSLTDIDTTDCANSLASLQLLAQKLHEKDPTKLECWDPTTMVPPLLPAGRESSDDEDGGSLTESMLNENNEKDTSDLRTILSNDGQSSEDARIMYSATDT